MKTGGSYKNRTIFKPSKIFFTSMIVLTSGNIPQDYFNSNIRSAGKCTKVFYFLQTLF